MLPRKEEDASQDWAAGLQLCSSCGTTAAGQDSIAPCDSLHIAPVTALSQMFGLPREADCQAGEDGSPGRGPHHRLTARHR